MGSDRRLISRTAISCPSRCHEPPFGDLDGDGAIGGADLAILLGNWGAY